MIGGGPLQGLVPGSVAEAAGEEVDAAGEGVGEDVDDALEVAEDVVEDLLYGTHWFSLICRFAVGPVLRFRSPQRYRGRSGVLAPPTTSARATAFVTGLLCDRHHGGSGQIHWTS